MEKELRNLHIINFINFFYIFFGTKLESLSYGGQTLVITQNQEWIPSALVICSLYILIRTLQYITKDEKGTNAKNSFAACVINEAERLGEKKLYAYKLNNDIEGKYKKYIEESKEDTNSTPLIEHFDVRYGLLGDIKVTFSATKRNHLAPSKLTIVDNIKISPTELARGYIMAFSKWAGFDIHFTETIIPIIICITICSTIFIEKIL